MKTAALTYWDTGFGTKRDVDTLSGLLRAEGFRVIRIPTRRRGDRWERRWKFLKQKILVRSPYTVQFHLEQIYWEQFGFARNNFIIPNPEFTDPDVFAKCRRLNGLLVKTLEAELLFQDLQVPVRYIGFGTPDRGVPAVNKRYDRFLHVEGKSDFKGSRMLVELWHQHPEWPELVVVRSPLDSYGNRRSRHPGSSANVHIVERFLSEAELLQLQNESGFHLCPSQVEGFGHYIVEALSCGAIVLTTDAPPMNEHVTEDHGFRVAAPGKLRQAMTHRYYFDPVDFERQIERMLKLSPEQCIRMSARAREVFLTRQSEFQLRFGNVLDGLQEARAWELSPRRASKQGCDGVFTLF